MIYWRNLNCLFWVFRLTDKKSMQFNQWKILSLHRQMQYLIFRTLLLLIRTQGVLSPAKQIMSWHTHRIERKSANIAKARIKQKLFIYLPISLEHVCATGKDCGVPFFEIVILKFLNPPNGTLNEPVMKNKNPPNCSCVYPDNISKSQMI